MKLDDRDKGYAWVILGAGAVVMFIGPSTYTAYGTLFASIELGIDSRLWILNLTCLLWFGIAPLAGPLATLNTSRRIVMSGLFCASCGLTLTAFTSSFPIWSFLTFSILVGIGVGMSIHETFFLIVSHFERYRGLAIGILQLSALLGQLITPLIYKSIPDVKDSFYIRALLTAIAFMSGSFYISPHLLPTLSLETPKKMEELEVEGHVASFHSKPHPSPRSGGHHAHFLKKSKEIRNFRGWEREAEAETHPLVTVHPTKQNNVYHHLHSHLDSAHCLPKIPEEAESMSSIVIDDVASREKLEVLRLKLKSIPIDTELKQRIGLKLNKSISASGEGESSSILCPSTSHTPRHDDDPSIQPLDPDLVKKVEAKIKNSRSKTNRLQNGTHPIRILRKSGSTGEAVTRRSMFRYRLDSIFDPQTYGMEINSTQRGRDDGVNERVRRNGLGHVWKEVILEGRNWNLLRNWRFLHMSLTCALPMVILPNFPIILTSHLLAIEKEKIEVFNGTNTTWLTQGSYPSDRLKFQHVESVLIMIYISDGISRLSMAYCSDYSLFSRKVTFYLTSLIGGFLIIGTSFTKDIEVIHVICCLYGFCYGTLVVTESLMFLDAFGLSKLPTSYGLMNAAKVLVILLLSPAMTSPVAGFMYPIQPFTAFTSWNDTTCQGEGCDPFDTFNKNENSAETMRKTSSLFLWIGICGILSGVSWILEILWNSYSAWKKEKEKKNLESKTKQDFFPFPGVRRARSNSNPI